MPRRAIRRLQVITPFGAGAMVDFPNDTLMTAGFEAWPDEPACTIQEQRLARRLSVQYFRGPPPARGEAQARALIPFVSFPLWGFCQRCRARAPARQNDLSRRIIIDPSHPATMTPEQRRTELACILAAGIIRRVEQRPVAALGGRNVHPTLLAGGGPVSSPNCRRRTAK